MDMTKVSLCLMLCHLFIVSSLEPVSSTCMGVSLPLVWLNISSSVPNPKEGADVTLTCDNDLPDVNLTFSWWKDEEKRPTTEKQLFLQKVLSSDSALYNCSVNSTCGSFSAQYKLNVQNDSVLILVVCGVSALVLVLIMGLAMKFKLKRDNARHRERRKQREQIGQSGGPAPFTPRQA